MEVEFIARYGKVLPKDTSDSLEDQAKILVSIDKSGELTMDQAKAKILDEDGIFEYGPWVVEMNDISDFAMVDQEHTKIFKYNGTAIILKINYMEFRMIKQFTTGKLVASSTDFIQMVPKTKPKIKRDGK